MKMKNLDIEMHNTLDITSMTQKEIEEAIHAVISGEKTFAVQGTVSANAVSMGSRSRRLHNPSQPPIIEA